MPPRSACVKNASKSVDLKGDQLVPGPQPLRQQRLLRAGLARVPRDEDGPGQPGEDADAGPARHLGLGDEMNPLARVEREDIEPRAVIGHHGAGPLHPPAPRLVPHAQHDEDQPAHQPRDMGRPGPAHPVQGPFGQPQDQRGEDAGQKDRRQRAPARDGPGNACHPRRRGRWRRTRIPGETHPVAPLV
jgi:hypothetical protein